MFERVEDYYNEDQEELLLLFFSFLFSFYLFYLFIYLFLIIIFVWLGLMAKYLYRISWKGKEGGFGVSIWCV